MGVACEPPRQHGFLLFELLVVILIASLLATWSASRWTAEMDDQSAIATAAWFDQVGVAVQQSLQVSVSELRRVDTNSRWRRDKLPYEKVSVLDMADLKGAGFLPQGFNRHVPLPYVLRIWVKQSAQACIGLFCSIEGLAVLIPESSELLSAQSSNRLGKLLAGLSGRGLAVHPLSAHQLRGPQMQLPNPPWPSMQALPVGTIALYFSSKTDRHRSNFGGVYWRQLGATTCRPIPGFAEYLNPLTGDCSCPDGFVAHQISQWQTRYLSERPTEMEPAQGFICIAPL